ncbi:MAG: lysozyme inhibitor LprI family protein [Bdellovibrionota bacterium]
MKMLLLSVLVLSSVSAFAKDCSEEMSTNDTFQCEVANYKAEDARLNDNYKKLMAKLDRVGQKKLQTAQRAWIAYKEADCEYSADEMRGGSYEKVILMGCLAGKTKERADVIQDGVDFR